MTATTASLQGLTQRLSAAIDTTIERFFEKNPQHISEMVRAGKIKPADPALAKRIFLHGRTGLDRMAGVREFAEKFESAAAPVARPGVATLAVGSQTSKSAGPTEPPPPAIRVTSDEKKVSAAAAAAGAAFAAAWEKLVEKVANRGHGEEPQQLQWTHGGRAFTALVAWVSPYRGIYQVVKPLVRVACVDAEAEKNEKVVQLTIGKVREAMKNRDVYEADRLVRAAGSVDGFSTTLVGA